MQNAFCDEYKKWSTYLGLHNHVPNQTNYHPKSSYESSYREYEEHIQKHIYGSLWFNFGTEMKSIFEARAAAAVVFLCSLDESGCYYGMPISEVKEEDAPGFYKLQASNNAKQYDRSFYGYAWPCDRLVSAPDNTGYLNFLRGIPSVFIAINASQKEIDISNALCDWLKNKTKLHQNTLFIADKKMGNCFKKLQKHLPKGRKYDYFQYETPPYDITIQKFGEYAHARHVINELHPIMKAAYEDRKKEKRKKLAEQKRREQEERAKREQKERDIWQAKQQKRSFLGRRLGKITHNDRGISKF